MMDENQPNGSFQEPKSVAEAVARKNQLGMDIQSIQQQLGNRDRQIDGRRMTDHEYWQWHKSASVAKTWKIRELHKIKEWLVRQTVGVHSPVATVKRARSLLLYRCVRALLLDAPASERNALVEMIDAFLDDAANGEVD